MSLFRLVAGILVTAVSYLHLELGNLLLRPWPRRREALRSFILRHWSRGMRSALGVSVERRGIPPREPFLLVANHLTYLDIVLLGGETGGIFVAKSELRRWPVVGRLCHAAGVIFVDRESKRDVVRVGRRIEETLALGRGVILFPEGTTSPGRSLLPFRASLLEVAARGDHPVHHAVLSYCTAPSAPPPEEAVCWYGGEPFTHHVRRFLRVPGVSGRVVFGVEPIRDRDRKQLAQRLRSAMLASFVPSVRQAEEAEGYPLRTEPGLEL